jgi:pyruvoyl-dependent arginine decarboxylase (PvlArgDC)
MSQELNQALTTAAEDPNAQGYCQEIMEIVTARSQGQLTKEEAEYLLKEMAEVKLAQETAVNEQCVRWLVTAVSLAAKLV